MFLLIHPIQKKEYAVALALGALLCGCGNMSGLDGSSEYGCKAPAGVQCQSVSGTYHNAIRGTKRLPSAGPVATQRALLPLQGATPADSAMPPLPLRTAPRILRLWIKAWEDAEHDLVDQSYVYVRIDGGQWQLEHVQRKVREAYAPLRPPVVQGTAANQASMPVPAPEMAVADTAKGDADGAAAPPVTDTPAANVAGGGR